MYYPLKFFSLLGFICMLAALLLGVRFLYYYTMGNGSGHVQSLILLAIIALTGLQCFILGLVADVVAANRRLLEESRLRSLRPPSPRSPGL
jgi:hypothetical protein